MAERIEEQDDLKYWSDEEIESHDRAIAGW